MNKITEVFETWWEREGQEFLFALNTTTDDDIKLVAEIAWRNGAYCAEPVKQKPVAYLCSGYMDSFPTGRHETCEATDYGAFPVYAEPVSVEVIRAEALEEAARMCDEYHVASEYPGYIDCAAAIRGLK